MADVLRVGQTVSAGDAQTQAALNAVIKDVELRSKFGTATPDNTVGGKIYFQLSATTSGNWTEVSKIWIKA